MRAIVDINGKQYEVQEGRYVQIDSFAAQENEEVVLGNVRMIIAGEDSLIGAPYIDGAVVKTRVKRHGRGPKVLVYKMRCKKGYRRKNGHRQGFTELQVELLDFPGKDALAAKYGTVEAPVEKKAKKAKTEDAPAGETKPKKAPKAKAETADATAEAPKAKKSKAKPANEEPKAEAPVAEAAVAEETKPAEATTPDAGETAADSVE